ncbi:hypothetical protein BOTBODRAFT_146369 [Botryobasidium botryosum FD-172 SS1]|uniref:Heterokaryon incompatibility domain-containing protein n=1 Tax=Botryobasidium botryosum (strain FD-172 SS1) TaxID=930990 RepID=A0A067MN80_BOTB1|nr:hypothetical protein BOTBODRAFT_146369 [Botryobasidium botryosum FD-172 SS1]
MLGVLHGTFSGRAHKLTDKSPPGNNMRPPIIREGALDARCSRNDGGTHAKVQRIFEMCRMQKLMVAWKLDVGHWPWWVRQKLEAEVPGGECMDEGGQVEVEADQGADSPARPSCTRDSTLAFLVTLVYLIRLALGISLYIDGTHFLMLQHQVGSTGATGDPNGGPADNNTFFRYNFTSALSASQVLVIQVADDPRPPNEGDSPSNPADNQYSTKAPNNLSSDATLRSYQRLDIYELEELGDTNYAAISYVWRGVPRDRVPPQSISHKQDELGMFVVRGAEDADPISIDVLLDICSATVIYDKNERFGVSWGVGPDGYMWLDRLCILQSSKADKAWQISRMYGIYQSCKICAILPGGLSRFVTIDEDTTWVERAWTLQEAIVPVDTLVFFARDPRSELDSRAGGFRENVNDRVSHTFLFSALQAGPAFGFGKLQREALERSLPDSAFGGRRAEDLRIASIWKSALMRTSSRPVDMILSIMQFFNVSLDPKQFEAHDRLGATIALAKQILQRPGGAASWLQALYKLEPCPQLSTWPQFPETSVDGKAYFRGRDGIRREVSEVIHSLPERTQGDPHMYSTEADMLTGEMSDDGYLTLNAHAHPLIYAGQNPDHSIIQYPPVPNCGPPSNCQVHAADGSIWRIPAADEGEISQHTSAFAVWIGRALLNAELQRNGMFECLVFLLILEHAPGKFHRVTYIEMDVNDGRFTWPGVALLKNAKFCIGGPEPLGGATKMGTTGGSE